MGTTVAALTVDMTAWLKVDWWGASPVEQMVEQMDYYSVALRAGSRADWMAELLENLWVDLMVVKMVQRMVEPMVDLMAAEKVELWVVKMV